MSAFRLRPVTSAEPPRYPAAPAPGEPAKAPMLANRISPLAPLAMLAIGGVSFCVRPAAPVAAAAQEAGAPREQEPPDAGRRPIARLTPAELEGLLDEAEERQAEVMAIKGKVAARTGFLSEAEVRRLLEALLRKNGWTAAASRIRRGGVDFEVDAWDAGRAVGIEVRGAKENCSRAFVAAEDDLTPAEIEDLELLRARGEMRVLFLDGARYEYDKDGRYRGYLPTRTAVVHRLLGEIERFLEEVGE